MYVLQSQPFQMYLVGLVLIVLVSQTALDAHNGETPSIADSKVTEDVDPGIFNKEFHNVKLSRLNPPKNAHIRELCGEFSRLELLNFSR
jgi:hypothetical protein